MDKKTLRQYRSLKRELESLDKKLDRLSVRALDVPTVVGTVQASCKNHPYTRTRIGVWMDEPVKMGEIKKLRRINEKRHQEVSELKIEIEEFIAEIPDSETRRIFEYTYMDGMSQTSVAEIMGFDQSSISKKIKSYLQLSYNS